MKDDRILPTIEDRKVETSTTRKMALKKERIPVAKQTALTYTDKEPGWHYRMVNDVPGRVQQLLTAGWELVKGNVEDTYSGKGRKERPDQGSYIKRIVDPNHIYTDGILMRIRIDMWNEDQQAKEIALDRLEEDLDGCGELKRARQLGPIANLRKTK